MENVNNLLISFRERVVNISKKMNLVSRKDVENLAKNLTEESLLPLEWNVCNLRSRVIDIGTGAGFPGIPLKLVRPDLEIVLVDSNRRKCAFLKTTIREMELYGISVINDRVESLVINEQNRNRFNTLLSRGVKNTSQMLHWADYLLSDGGEVILWKGSGFDSEIRKINLKKWAIPDTLRLPSGLVLVRFFKKGE